MNRSILQNPKVTIAVTVLVMILAFLGVYWFLTHSFLIIRLNPQDAIVTLNNAPLEIVYGRTKINLPPGEYDLRVEADGYIGWFEKITLGRSRAKSLNINLKETPRAFKIADGAILKKSSDFNAIYYLGDSGKRLYKDILTLDDSGNIKVKSHLAITEPKLSGIKEIIWSPNGELALFRKDDGIYLFDFKKYDFVNQTETSWGKDIGPIAWSPDNSKIAYYYAPQSGERSLVFANLANTEMTRVANLSELQIENPILRWSPDSEWLVVISRNTSSYNLCKIYLFNAYSRNFKEATDTGNQLDAIFSPDNNKIIYATYSRDENNPIRSYLSLMDADGNNKRNLDLRADINKIAWAKDNKKIIVASYNEQNKREALFGFNLETKSKNNFSIGSIDQGYINSLSLTDDEKIIVYETKEGIFGLKIE